MEKLRLIVAAGALALGCTLAGGSSQAAVIGPAVIGTAADVGALVEPVQYRFGGNDFCWYPDGWQGPGWYWCGYAHRVGFGWGGGVGWNGWRHEEFRHDHDHVDFRFRDHDHDHRDHR